MTTMTSPYLFAVCQAGAEATLKRELGQRHPQLKLAFSRPGFVTFKSPTPLADDFALAAVFARAYGLSLGQAGTVSAPADLRQLLPATLWNEPNVPALHVFSREGPRRDDADPAHASQELARSVAERLAKPLPRLARAEEPLALGQGVIDVVILEPDAGGDSPLYVGFHRHGLDHSPWPGARPNITLPAAAPSRAYLKLEEALRRIDAPTRPGDVAIEVGCAPGGAAYALLERGLEVYGVDAAACAPIVRDSPRFVAVRKSIAAVKPQELPKAAHWLMFDINAGAFRSVPAAKKLVERYTASMLGLVLTLKLARWDKAHEIPHIVDQVSSWGFAQVLATQLYYNRQEVVIMALMPRARERRR